MDRRPKELVIEYEEVLVEKGESLRINADGALSVRILDVTQVGPDLRYSYAIIWENGDA